MQFTFDFATFSSITFAGNISHFKNLLAITFAIASL